MHLKGVALEMDNLCQQSLGYNGVQLLLYSPLIQFLL